MADNELGTIEASEKLIKDLYVDLRVKVNEWSAITQQTPQARMGYVGQHLVSIVTGYCGGRSGARGHDLEMEGEDYGEIKTCYRVDQLGACRQCGAAVSSLEKQCPSCHSTDIERKDDSKWLIAIQHNDEFEAVLDPKRYYFVLFEFDDIDNDDDNDIVASIWEVDPKEKGFAYCMIDYYLNIRANSKSKAPFNMWPYSFKYALTKPKLIYRSIIDENGTITTDIFPTKNNAYVDELLPLGEYASAKSMTKEALRNLISKYGGTWTNGMSKKDLAIRLQTIRERNNIPNDELCDELADEVYLPLLRNVRNLIPRKYRERYGL